jgi:hypothetical protein
MSARSLAPPDCRLPQELSRGYRAHVGKTSEPDSHGVKIFSSAHVEGMNDTAGEIEKVRLNQRGVYK